jgi:hypothetical protein
MPRNTHPLRLPNDPPEMRAAIERLEQYDGLRRTSVYQLKIGDVNFYPGTGSVQIDRLAAQKKKGIEEVLRLLQQRNLLKLKGFDTFLYQINADI